MEKTVISSMVMMRSCTGLVLPRTAPKEIRTVAVLKSALIILQERKAVKVQQVTSSLFLVSGNSHLRRSQTHFKMLILILPSSRCQKPCMRRPHCRPKAARSRLTPTLLNPYCFRKVMRKPKPMKIMT